MSLFAEITANKLQKVCHAVESLSNIHLAEERHQRLKMMCLILVQLKFRQQFLANRNTSNRHKSLLGKLHEEQACSTIREREIYFKRKSDNTFGK